MEEMWKDIPGLEGKYQASNLGRIRSLDRSVYQKNNTYRRIKGRVLSCHTNKQTGYVSCMIGRDECNLVHRLVAMTWIPNPNNLPCVDHINGIRTDNRIENLRWTSYKQNNNNVPIVRELETRIAELEAEVETLRQELASRS